MSAPCSTSGGVLIYETFMLGNEAYGKPSNPEFLLRPGELRAVARAAGLREIAFEEGYADAAEAGAASGDLRRPRVNDACGKAGDAGR